MASLVTVVLLDTYTFLGARWERSMGSEESLRSSCGIEPCHHPMVLCVAPFPDVFKKEHVLVVNVFVHISIKICLPEGSVCMVIESWVYLSNNKPCAQKNIYDKPRWQSVWAWLLVFQAPQEEYQGLIQSTNDSNLQMTLLACSQKSDPEAAQWSRDAQTALWHQCHPHPKGISRIWTMVKGLTTFIG